MTKTTWPEDPIERIEAKIDAALNNHLPHIEGRVAKLERLFLEKQRWAFWTGLSTFVTVIYLVIR